MNDKIISINITTGSILRVALTLILIVILYLLRDLALILLTSVVIASAVLPATKWFAKYRVHRVPAVLFVYIAIVAVLTGVFYLFVPPLFNEVTRISSELPKYIEIFSLSEVIGIVGSDSTQNVVKGLSGSFSIEGAIQSIQSAVAELSSGVFQTVSTIFGGVFSLILVVIISFYLAVQENGIEDFLRIIVPIKHEDYIIDLWKRSQAKIGKWMQGQLLLVLLIGILVYLGLTILGIPYATTLALSAALAELIPVFGPIIAAVPAVLLGFTGGATLGLMTVGLYIIIQQFENHLIYPLVVRKVVGVPPLLVIIALIIGGKMAGFLGVFLSVPIAAAFMEFANDVQKEKKKLHKPLNR